jgi:hypothetical protein
MVTVLRAIPSPRPLGSALILLMMVVTLEPTTARAHELVDEGRRLYEEAEFVAALDVLGRATAGDTLTTSDLEALLELRALVHTALGDAAAAEEDLRVLAVIAPDHALDRGIPPDLQRTFAGIRATSDGSPRLRATPTATAQGVLLEVALENDWASVVRAVRIRGRAGDAGPYLEATDAPLLVGTPLGEAVSYYAEAIGPGGAVVARVGSEGSPLRFAAASEPVTGGGGEIDPVPFVIAGVAAVAVGVIIAVVVVTTTGGQPDTVVEPFTVRF